ncbi:MAG TPA: hypothetical protein DCM86_09585, partial [Verrucomicrobiales bacterium]|nr:hypothetical protein [Verrucomicrobiales bacterium]
EIEDWEAELRRIVRDRPKQPLPPSFPRPPQPKVPPPPSEEGPDLEMPAPTASRRAMEEAQRLPEAVRARLQEASARLGQMAESRRAMAEGAGIETETAGEIRAGIAASLNLPRIPHDRPMHAEAAAVVQNL